MLVHPWAADGVLTTAKRAAVYAVCREPRNNIQGAEIPAAHNRHRLRSPLHRLWREHPCVSVGQLHHHARRNGLPAVWKGHQGFAVGAASTRFHLGEPRARILVLFGATVADAVIFEQLAQAFEVPTYRLSILGLLSRAVVNAALGAVVYELLGRRWRARRRI